MDFIQFTPAKFKAFKKLYARTKEGETFFFEGKEVLKEFAGYVILYLAPKFNKAVEK
jgi:hypothetical protein